ncbi:MAG: orotidine 5'-phosphate decarboxylase [Anaerolineae bacterium]|nr:orotidine 5'-phosphate decarboxylase [Anaerolineae bacterium]
MQMARQVVPVIPQALNIFIEAGTPYIKREGLNGIRLMRQLWQGVIVADMKVADGAMEEVIMARQAGANAVTCLGSAPTPTLDFFIQTCKNNGILSMIDLIGVKDPLTILRPLKQPADVIVLHRGRDEEINKNKLIEYRHINRIRSKSPSLISVAGGVDIREARSAIFNGANIVVANLVNPESKLTGISLAGEIAVVAQKFLETIA